METPHPETSERRQPNYLAIFIALAVLTAIEVGVTYLPIPRIPVLVPLAVFKAGLVVLFYMHLKSDSRVFSLIFGVGILMGISLMLAFLALFAPPLLDAVK